jgi:hypothetical protein
MRTHRFLGALILLLLFYSCKPIEALPPKYTVIAPPPLNQEPSIITIPLEIDLSPYLKEIEKSLPKTFEGEEQHCEGISYSYVFHRQPIEYFFYPDHLYYEVLGNFQLKLNYCPKCHSLFDEKGSCVVPRVYTECGTKDPLSIKVGYKTEISLNNKCQFESSTSLSKFDLMDPCVITLFKYDATSEVEKQVKGELKQLEEDIDKQIEAIDIRSDLKLTWKELQEPIVIDGYGFLYLNPTVASVSDLKFSKNKVAVDINLKVAPMVTTEALELKVQALPELKEFKKTRGIQMGIDISASYDSLSSMANKELRGKELKVKRKKIIIKELKIEGSQDNRMVFSLHFEGSKSGVFYVTALPVFDTLTQKISMENMSFEIETKSLLLNTARWLFNDRILQELEKNAIFDLNPYLKDAQTTITKELNAPLTSDVDMSGSIDDMRIKEIFLTSNYLILRSELKGQLKLKMH